MSTYSASPPDPRPVPGKFWPQSRSSSRSPNKPDDTTPSAIPHVPAEDGRSGMGGSAAGALAHDAQGSMPAFQTEIFDIGGAGFVDPQPVQAQQHRQRARRLTGNDPTRPGLNRALSRIDLGTTRRRTEAPTPLVRSETSASPMPPTPYAAERHRPRSNWPPNRQASVVSNIIDPTSSAHPNRLRGTTRRPGDG